MKRWIFYTSLAHRSDSLSVHNAGKNVLSLVKEFTAFAGTLYWPIAYLFERLVNKKKQYYTFNNSSTLQMFDKDHVLFFKKSLNFLSSVSAVYIIPNLTLNSSFSRQ